MSNIFNLFGDPDCCCPSPADLIRAELERVELELCPLHEADAIAERKIEQRRSELLRHEAQTVAAMERLEERWNEPPPCTCESTAAMLRNAIEGRPQELCAAHPSTTAPAPASFALNDNAAIASVLRGAVGGDATFNGEPPPAA